MVISIYHSPFICPIKIILKTHHPWIMGGPKMNFKNVKSLQFSMVQGFLSPNVTFLGFSPSSLKTKKSLVLYKEKIEKCL